MKSYILLFVLAAVVGQFTSAQTKSLPFRSISAPVPASYTIGSVNYIRTWEPAFPSENPSEVADPMKDVRNVKQSTQYFDGLGRLLQTVSKGTSGNGRDIVKPVIYDAFGREQFNICHMCQLLAI